MSGYGMGIFDQHAEVLAASGVTPEHAHARGYRSVDTKTRLERAGISRAGRLIPGLLIPSLRADGTTWGYQYRPDTPRLDSSGKPIKYETPVGQRNGIDVPPGVGPMLDDPNIPLWVTEGAKKADAGALAGLCIVALPGVWSWLGKNPKGGKVAISDWRDIALNDGRRVILAFDGDVSRKKSVRAALTELAKYLTGKGAHVEYLHMPDEDDKVGLDDYLMDGHTVEDLWALVRPEPPALTEQPAAAVPVVTPRPVPVLTPVPLDDALDTFRHWLHLDDEAPVLAVAAAVVANLAKGDPVWLLIVGPPSGGKTEILTATTPLPYIIPAATVTEASLLSGTASKERAKDATGGLLRQVGDFGILLSKDFTSVLSQNKDTAKAAISAMREIYDGSWDRPVGSDGGRVLHWDGKCGFIGGVTPSYDRYGSIVNSLGDRYLLLRLPDVDARAQALSALAQAEHEKPMRAALTAAMTGLIASADLTQVHTQLTDHETERLVRLAMFAARTRTAVERDGYSGDLLVVPQPEGPARLIKAMRRMYGALGALGVDSDAGWSVMERIALDCAPAIRVPLMNALIAATAPTRTSDLAHKASLVTKTAHRQLDDLSLLGVAELTKKNDADNSPDLWEASAWLREHWTFAESPPRTKVRQRYTTRREEEVKERPAPDEDDESPSSTSRTSLSHFPVTAVLCAGCGHPLPAVEIAAGNNTHANCQVA